MDTFPHHRLRRHRSRRGTRYRKNAAIGILLGFFTIIVGIALAVFRWGLFEEHSNEFVLGLITFFIGYITVIIGCSFWAKAKHWNEAIVLIGLAPIVLLFIPYVRLIFLVVPQIIFAGMLLMPAMLIAILAVLPDRR